MPALAAVLAGCGGGSDGSAPEAPDEVEVLDLRCEASPEPVSLRRLTRFEMENAISDALGVTDGSVGLAARTRGRTGSRIRRTRSR